MPEFVKRRKPTETPRVVGAKPDKAAGRPATLENPLLARHQAMGNQEVQRMLHSGTIQANLTINPPDDKYEKEADRVAEQAFPMPEAGSQHPVEEEEKEKKILGREPPVRHPVTGERDGNIRAPFIVHDDSRADESARSHHSMAYTVGRDILFSRGKYEPGIPAGRRLLAHELSHVIQQARGGSSNQPEQRANAAAESVVRGEAVSTALLGGVSRSVQMKPEPETGERGEITVKIEGEPSSVSTAPATPSPYAEPPTRQKVIELNLPPDFNLPEESWWERTERERKLIEEYDRAHPRRGRSLTDVLVEDVTRALEPVIKKLPTGLRGKAREGIRKGIEAGTEKACEAAIDATDQLEFPEDNPDAVEHGIQPQLSALETIIYPSSIQLLTNHALAQAGTLEIAPMEAPLSLFIWSKHRIMPVRITDFSITEEAFDPSLNTIRAKVGLGMRVLSVDDLGFSHKGGGLFMSYLQLKEQLAGNVKSAGLNTFGIGGIP